MSDFIIITKARVLENEPEEIVKEQEEKRKILGLGELPLIHKKRSMAAK